MIRSRISLLYLSNGIWGADGSVFLITSHAFCILLLVQNCLGLPTLRISVSLGRADVVEKVAWWRGWFLSLLRMCPSNLSFLSSKISVRGLIFRSKPVVGALRVSFALRYTYSLVLWRCMYVVCSFRIFRKPLSWNVLRRRPADSVGSKVSRP